MQEVFQYGGCGNKPDLKENYHTNFMSYLAAISKIQIKPTDQEIEARREVASLPNREVLGSLVNPFPDPVTGCWFFKPIVGLGYISCEKCNLPLFAVPCFTCQYGVEKGQDAGITSQMAMFNLSECLKFALEVINNSYSSRELYSELQLMFQHDWLKVRKNGASKVLEQKQQKLIGNKRKDRESEEAP